MLLFVCDPELDDGQDPPERLGAGCLDEAPQAFVDACAVVAHIGGARARKQTPMGACVARTFCVVVRVVEQRVPWIDGRDPRGLEDEGLEEPGRVRPVPLGRARVGHRLELLVLGREARRESLGAPPRLRVKTENACPLVLRIATGHRPSPIGKEGASPVPHSLRRSASALGSELGDCGRGRHRLAFGVQDRHRCLL